MMGKNRSTTPAPRRKVAKARTRIWRLKEYLVKSGSLGILPYHSQWFQFLQRPLQGRFRSLPAVQGFLHIFPQDLIDPLPWWPHLEHQVRHGKGVVIGL